MSSSTENNPRAGIHHRQELQAAIAKAVELRALHAALLQGSCAASPALIRLPQAVASPSLSSKVPNQFSAGDYPVFTPSYEDTFPRANSICPETRSLSDNWSASILDRETQTETEIVDEERETLARDELSSFSPNNFSSSNSEPPFMNRVHCSNHLTHPVHHLTDSVRHLTQTPLSQNAPLFFPKSVSTCNSCKPATINNIINNHNNNKKLQKGQILSWLFNKASKGKKTKTRSATSPNTIGGSENMSQLLKEWGVFSLESLKKELMEANENRDSALAEVAEMRGSLTELTSKLVSLESYCEELKNALVHAKNVDRSNLSKRTNSIRDNNNNNNNSYNNNSNNNNGSNYLPVSHEVMVEGFLQVVSEARLSVKQFCKALINQMEEMDGSSSELLERINILFQSDHVLTSNTNRLSKHILYHLEAVMNLCFYQDFENCVFRKNGCAKNLDPKKEIQENFQNFVALRNLSWNEVLKKGTKFYSEDFSKFCDQKMSLILSELNWSRAWPENILQHFFVASKCIWLLHLLAFSFTPPLVILRVEENRKFDSLYMEEILLERQTGRVAGRVKIMVVPGFYVQDKVLKCRVLCTYRS